MHDVTQASALLTNIVPEAVLADKAYDTDALLMHIVAIGAKAVIPPKANRKVQRHFDRHQYRNRNLIERFFAQLKQFRRVATRYDKLVSRFESFVIVAASVLWLKWMSTRPNSVQNLATGRAQNCTAAMNCKANHI